MCSKPLAYVLLDAGSDVAFLSSLVKLLACQEAVNEMLEKTNTSYAPWHILESNDKKYARIKALKTVIEAIEKYEVK